MQAYRRLGLACAGVYIKIIKYCVCKINALCTKNGQCIKEIRTPPGVDPGFCEGGLNIEVDFSEAGSLGGAAPQKLEGVFNFIAPKSKI